MARIDAIEGELDGSPGTTEVLVQAETRVEGSVEDEAVAETTEYTLQIEPEGSTYRIDGPTSQEETYQSVEQVTTPVEYGPLRSGGTVLLFVLSLAGLVGLVAAQRTGRLLSEHERQVVEHARERKEFDDWISRGRLPEELRGQPWIEVESLEELVDVAIDSDRRVIEDTVTEEYYVVSDGHVYAYSPPDDTGVSNSEEMESTVDDDSVKADDEIS